MKFCMHIDSVDTHCGDYMRYSYSDPYTIVKAKLLVPAYAVHGITGEITLRLPGNQMARFVDAQGARTMAEFDIPLPELPKPKADAEKVREALIAALTNVDFGISVSPLPVGKAINAAENIRTALQLLFPKGLP